MASDIIEVGIDAIDRVLRTQSLDNGVKEGCPDVDTGITAKRRGNVTTNQECFVPQILARVTASSMDGNSSFMTTR